MLVYYGLDDNMFHKLHKFVSIYYNIILVYVRECNCANYKPFAEFTTMNTIVLKNSVAYYIPSTSSIGLFNESDISRWW